MPLSAISGQPSNLHAIMTAILDVLKLFVIPVGGGIPAGVLKARDSGLAWPVTAAVYLLSDLILAVLFEPVLRLLEAVGRKIPFLARFGAAMKTASARSTAHFGGTGAGPLALVMIAFGVDPMSGRAAALAAGHGFITGWAIAITGDMLYFAVIAVSTLELNSYIRDPNTTMLIILAAMFLAPALIRTCRNRFRSGRSTGQTAIDELAASSTAGDSIDAI